MENLIRNYLRILDIDPWGYFIRLINLSRKESLDLSAVGIQQLKTNYRFENDDEQNPICNLYIFNKNIRSLLKSNQIVTIYSRHHGLYYFDMEPYVFIAHNVLQWLNDTRIRTEILIDNIRVHSVDNCYIGSNDIPFLFAHRSTNTDLCLPKSITKMKPYTRQTFPYCLSIDNIVHPHASGLSVRHGIEHVQDSRCLEKK